MRDYHNHKKVFENWMESVDRGEGIKGLNEKNSQYVISCIKDFKIGLNVSQQSKKGERSYIRLNHFRQKVAFIIRMLQERGIKDVTEAKPEDLHTLFSDMRTGKLKTRTGTPYKSAGDYVKEFKTFWHWYQKTMKKKGKLTEDITEDLDARGEKPRFVYFTKEECEKIIDKASYDLKPVLALAFDSGARVKALINIKVSDFSNDFKELNIRDEISKTFGRKIKLMLCSEQIKQYVKKLELAPEDYLCRLHVRMISKELKELGEKLLTPEQIKFKNLSLYDFRHSSACFWLPRYKSESALKYRFGWKKSDMIHYYTEFLGMKDTIKEEDLYVDLTKAELEKEISKLKRSSKAHNEAFKKMDKLLLKMAIILQLVSKRIIKDKGFEKEILKEAKEMMSRGELAYSFYKNL